MLWLELLTLPLAVGCKSEYGLHRVSEESWGRSSQRSALDSKSLSQFTALALKQRNFDAHDLDTAIASLHRKLQQTRSRHTVAAMAEACYLRAKKYKKYTPTLLGVYRRPR